MKSTNEDKALVGLTVTIVVVLAASAVFINNLYLLILFMGIPFLSLSHYTEIKTFIKKRWGNEKKGENSSS